MPLFTLGDMQLSGFAVPGQVRFGGAQRMAVHSLIGGARAIDVLGRDDGDISWSGILAGQNAAEQAAALDAARAAGETLPLSWDFFCYDVVIADLALEYRNPWWIDYTISCTVLADLAQAPPQTSLGLSADVLTDLTAASGFGAASGALAQLSLPGALDPGVGGIVQSIAAVAGARSALQQEIGQQEAALQSASLADAVSAAGSLAQATCASGYVGRALMNLQANGG